MPFEQYKKTITSQWGEDGIIEEILKRLGVGGKICVEIGAWDGKHLSNTWSLWHDQGWSAVLVEGESEKVYGLNQIAKKFPKVMPYLAFVRKDGENSIDNILNKTIGDKKVDLMSIDIDGDDYYLFQSLKKYLPRVLIIEYNPTVPADVDLVQTEGESFGASALSLCKLAETKGYSLVAITQTNLFFVLNSEFNKLGISFLKLNEVFNNGLITNVFVSFDGRAVMTNYPNLLLIKPRHKTPIQFSTETKYVPVKIKLAQSFIESVKRKLRMRRKYKTSKY